MKVLITGVSGFVGRHLAERLAASGSAEIYGIDVREPDPGLGRVLHFRVIDMLDRDGLEDVLASVRPDEVYHLAAQSSVAGSWEKERETYEVNVFSQLNLLSLLVELDLDAKVLVVGSGEEYGKAVEEEMPLRETAPLRPVSPYGVSKVVQDLMAYQYFQSEGLRTVRVRPFNHIGPAQSASFVCSDFARQIAMIEAGLCEPRMVVGNLSAVRDFTDVRDVVEAYILLMKNGEAGEVYNVCSSRGVSISELLGLFLEMANVKIAVEVESSKCRPFDIPVLIGDNSKLKAEVGWEPKIHLRQSIADVLEHWRARYGNREGKR